VAALDGGRPEPSTGRQGSVSAPPKAPRAPGRTVACPSEIRSTRLSAWDEPQAKTDASASGALRAI